jgi:hypothetical protein
MIKCISLAVAAWFVLVACNNDSSANGPAAGTAASGAPAPRSNHFRGALTGGFKGDSIFFDVNKEGTRIENLTFKGYWRCSGKLEMLRAAGPDGSFPLINGSTDGHISEPPNGGATSWRFDLSAKIDGSTASGTFRMNINALDCNTGMLKWTAVAY